MNIKSHQQGKVKSIALVVKQIWVGIMMLPLENFIQQMFIEVILCTRRRSRPWGEKKKTEQTETLDRLVKLAGLCYLISKETMATP